MSTKNIKEVAKIKIYFNTLLFIQQYNTLGGSTILPVNSLNTWKEIFDRENPSLDHLKFLFTVMVDSIQYHIKNSPDEFTDSDGSYWRFVEKHYPDYSRSNEIGWADDLQCLIDDEVLGSDHKEDLLRDKYDNDINNPKLYQDHYELEIDIMDRAIQEYMLS